LLAISPALAAALPRETAESAEKRKRQGLALHTPNLLGRGEISDTAAPRFEKERSVHQLHGFIKVQRIPDKIAVKAGKGKENDRRRIVFKQGIICVREKKFRDKIDAAVTGKNRQAATGTMKRYSVQRVPPIELPSIPTVCKKSKAGFTFYLSPLLPHVAGMPKFDREARSAG
jgi:hypothetical protein